MEKLQSIANQIIYKIIENKYSLVTVKMLYQQLMIDTRRIGEVFTIIDGLKLFDKLDFKTYSVPPQQELQNRFHMICTNCYDTGRKDSQLQQTALGIIRTLINYPLPMKTLSIKFQTSRRFYDAINILIGLEILYCDKLNQLISLNTEVSWISCVTVQQQDYEDLKTLQVQELYRLAQCASPTTNSIINNLLPTPKSTQDLQNKELPGFVSLQ
ncbi:hypothetical protein SS50377_21029 [Spironucleus salmonicida]|uniref:Uncharacterized protein n=1 Tax=Spironucleus salmonicida TaxID=348837 RepID=V6LGM8_9EUKA|nr:hypothetical protein SS50377_21029 [Spironucleus salmonicida]|eukprot:EST43690.1 Hypothetical protein SS50377_16740 [Spironucleus salmonicida]